MTTISRVGLPRSVENLFSRRAAYSHERLRKLTALLKKAECVSNFRGFTIFTAGSYGRLEASQFSDIDPFFIVASEHRPYDGIRLPAIRMLSEVIGICDRLRFPEFSNDGEFLQILRLDLMLSSLGSPEDDYNNYFTARMLLMLESRPLFGARIYDSALRKIVDTYFRDYPYHPKDFRPIFLINDILRFWKTLCLNYENKRNQEDERNKNKQKIKNFKLKYSRLMTCFATVAKLSAYRGTINPNAVLAICRETPAQRLRSIAHTHPRLRGHVKEALTQYAWFLAKTGISAEDLERNFGREKNRQDAFDHAARFGDTIYEIVRNLNEETGNLRYLVV